MIFMQSKTTTQGRKTTMTNTFIDIHAIQNIPPSNINRDDTGSPKTALYGGYRRARVSSQSWKKAMRDWMSLQNDDRLYGIRTRNIVDLIGNEIRSRERFSTLDDDQLVKFSREIVTDLGFKFSKKHPEKTEYLIFASKRQISNVIDAVESLNIDPMEPKITSKDKNIIRSKMSIGNSVDLSLFGRMIADDTDLRVDAAVQVAHAIGVDSVQSEFDYFTAVDDYNNDRNDDDQSSSGAGMIGTIEYDSSTLYRYANMSIRQLRKNLDGDEVYEKKAVANFITAFIESMPSGKQNGFAAQTMPSVIIVEIRDSRPMNYVSAFEKPVASTSRKSITDAATERLMEHIERQDKAFGAPLHRYVINTTPCDFNGAEATDLQHLPDRVVDDIFVDNGQEEV